MSYTICPKTQRGQTERLYHMLDTIGPMTAAELERLMNRSRPSVNESLRLLRRSTPKRIHIHRYDRQPDGTRGRCVPVYAVGDLPDAPEPGGLSSKQRNEKYRQRHRARLNARNRARRGSVGPNIWMGLVR